MLSRVEEKYYRNIDKIAGSLERVAAALEKANKQNVQDAKGPIEEPIEILSDGTMFVNDIHNVTRVKRVIVNERGTHLCKQFYMDGGPEPEEGEWIVKSNAEMPGQRSSHTCTCSKCGTCYYCYDKGQYQIELSNFCPNCGKKMVYRPERSEG